MKARFLFLLFILPLFSLAQEEDTMKTLFSKKSDITGFGSFDMVMTTLHNKNTLLLGGHGGLIFNRQFIVGLGGYGIASNNTFQGGAPEQELRITGGYGGIMTGYIFKPMEVFHLHFPLFLGLGGMDLVDANFQFDPDQIWLDDTVESSLFYVVEPGVQAQVNIHRFFRMSLGVGYRITSGAEFSEYSIGDKEMSGLTGQVSFRFGMF